MCRPNACGGEAKELLGLGWSRLSGQLHHWCAGLKALLLDQQFWGLECSTWVNRGHQVGDLCLVGMTF